MLGVLVAVAFIATTGVYGSQFSEDALERSYWFDPTEFNAQFLKPDIQIELYRNFQIDQNDRITVSRPIGQPNIQTTPSQDVSVHVPEPLQQINAQITPLQDVSVDELLEQIYIHSILSQDTLLNVQLEQINTELLCGDFNGILFSDTQTLFCDVSSFSWVYDFHNSVPRTTYFSILLYLGPHGPLQLTVPVFEELYGVTMDEDWERDNKAIRLSKHSPQLLEQLRDILENRADFLKFSPGHWLNKLFEFKIFKNENLIMVDNEEVISHVTRPVLVPRSLITMFLGTLNNLPVIDQDQPEILFSDVDEPEALFLQEYFLSDVD